MKTAVFLSLTLFIVGLLTLPHYGINWDTINHLPRGQAYLHYFLTGKKDYQDLPVFEPYYQQPASLGLDANKPTPEITRRSYYQNDSVTFDTYMMIDGDGHPPISDIISAFFNLILFQKLALINDIDAYRVYGVLTASLLLGLVFFWTAKVYGNFAGVIAVLSLASYPLFFSELHFNNEKDIPEAFYFSLFLFLVWQAITKKSVKLALTAGVVFGLGLGTKFNILFAAVVVVLWLMAQTAVYLFTRQLKALSQLTIFLKDSTNRRLTIALSAIPLIGFILLIVSWPYLWQDLISGILRVMNFYKTIGLTSSIDPRFVGPLGINTYPLQWILYTTPPLVLLLLAVGLIKAVAKFGRDQSMATLLFLLWLIVTIGRVSWPGTTIYGGVRQIMEYIPVVAIVAGLGASTLLKWKVINKKLMGALILLAFIPVVVRLIQIHPNENVYFNFLVGGLAGAKQQQIPSWGNSFGAAYRQGIIWLNQHAESKAEAVFVHELMPNIPLIWVREDILFHNSRRSGPLRKGEYAMTLTYDGISERSYYDKYLETMIEPVYQVTVDGVPILKIWKNDLEHTKIEYQRQEVVVKANFKTSGNILEIDLGKPVALSFLDANYNQSNCSEIDQAEVETSQDGRSYLRLIDGLPTGQISVYGQQPNNGRLVYSFLGEQARYIRFQISPPDACLFNLTSLKVYFYPKE